MKSHPRQCHLCPHDGRRSRACLTCKAPDLDHRANHVQLRTDVPAPSVDTLLDCSRANAALADRLADERDALLDILRRIAWMNDNDLVLLAHLARGETQEQMAHHFKVTKQAVSKRIAKATANNPMIAKLRAIG